MNKNELLYPATPGPEYVVSENCGIRQFEHDMSSRQKRGIRVRRIVGGMEAVRGSLPWQVSQRTVQYCNTPLKIRRTGIRASL